MQKRSSIEILASVGMLLAVVTSPACSSNPDDKTSTMTPAGGSSATGGAYAGGAPVTSGTGGAPQAGSGGAASGAGGAAAGSTSGGTGGGSAAGAGGGAACLPNAAPPETTGVCAGKATRVLSAADSKVENFEDATISPGWSSFDEPDNGGAHDVFKMTLVSSDGAATTKQSGEYQGTGVKTVKEGGFGAGTVFNVAIDKTNGFYCIDVSAFDGVAFWAKAGTAGKQINVSFVVPETNPQGAPGGDCAANCYNHPSKTITLTDQWAQYTVKFAEAIAGTAKVNGRIQELLWTTPDKDFDIHLDEIGFYKCMPPAGPVGP